MVSVVSRFCRCSRSRRSRFHRWSLPSTGTQGFSALSCVLFVERSRFCLQLFSLCINTHLWGLLNFSNPPLVRHVLQRAYCLKMIIAQCIAVKKERLLHFLVSLDIEKLQTRVIITINSAPVLGSCHTCASPPHLTATWFYHSRTMAGGCSSHLLSPPSLPNFSPQTVAFSWFRSHIQRAGDSSSSRLTGLDIKSLCSL